MTREKAKKFIFQFLRWGIAILGIAWVVYNINLSDHVLVEDSVSGRPVEAAVRSWPQSAGGEVQIVDPRTGEIVVRPYSDLLMRPDRKYAVRASDNAKLQVLAVRPLSDWKTNPVPRELMVAEDANKPGTWVTPEQIKDGYRVQVEFPLREIGLIRMVQEADTTYLLLAVLVIPIVYLITGYRWYLLLAGLEVPIPLMRALQINLVGAFYNTFMPGSTGGDVLKAYYAAKNAKEHRTRAVLSVIIDRAIGLVALIIMGGICAAFQWHIPQCRRVAIAAAVICGLLTVGILVFAYRPLRRALGLEWMLSKLPLQDKVNKTTEGLRLYKRRPMLAFWALAMSFPVHATVVISAMFAGLAFGLPIPWAYYWVVVPTVVLSGALPISPQGAGVMEFFAILLTRPLGATIGQAFALTLSIRLVQIVWNLLAGLLLISGSYRAPTEQEQKAMETDADPVVNTDART